MAEHRTRVGGLRERKKERTKLAIQRVALQLFREQGYDNTTIEQIAEAAEISRASIFRYFPTKADIVLFDVIDARVLEAFHAQPAEANPVRALRIALRDTVRQAAAADLQPTLEKEALIRHVLGSGTVASVITTRALPVLTSAIAERAGLAADDLGVRAMAGAVVGVITAIWTNVPEKSEVDDSWSLLERLDAALEYLEADFPELPSPA